VTLRIGLLRGVAWAVLLFGCGNSEKNPAGSTSIRTLTEDLRGVSIEFVWIEPGTFLMGSPETEIGRDPNEGPQHEVTITQGFWLAKYEITQAQWEAVTGETPWADQLYVQPDPDHPAVYISWHDIQSFIQLANKAAGDSLYRLPTEAEWEYACRARTTTPWSFGEDENELNNYSWHYDTTPHSVNLQYAQPVGRKLPNPWGLYDMHGNVWEWTQTWHGPYGTSPTVDPQGPQEGRLRVHRGGSWGLIAAWVRSAFRPGGDPRDYRSDLGARLLRREIP
jgi:formylglycine-generating enzyme required for sulfatase activity